MFRNDNTRYFQKKGSVCSFSKIDDASVAAHDTQIQELYIWETKRNFNIKEKKRTGKRA